MKAILVLCAEGTSIDAQSNVASIFNILEEATPEGLPFAIQKMIFFAHLTRDANEPSEVTLALHVLNNDQELISQRMPISFQGKFRTRVITNIMGLSVSAAGSLKFILRDHNGGELGRWQIAINTPPPRLKR